MNSLENNVEDSKGLQEVEIENESSRLSSVEYYENSSSNKKDIKNKCYKRIIVIFATILIISLIFLFSKNMVNIINSIKENRNKNVISKDINNYILNISNESKINNLSNNINDNKENNIINITVNKNITVNMTNNVATDNLNSTNCITTNNINNFTKNKKDKIINTKTTNIINNITINMTIDNIININNNIK